MPQQRVKVLGSAFVDPASDGVDRWPLDLAAGGDYAWSRSESVEISATELAPYAMAPAGKAVRLVAARAPKGSSFVAVVTSALGANQEIPFSEMLILEVPRGTPLTAIGLVGEGWIEYVTAGD